MTQTRRKPRRIYTPQHIVAGIKAVSKLQAAAIDFVPPTIPAAGGQEVAPETHNGYCVKCREKKEVVTEGKKATKSSAMRPHGPCPDCGTQVSAFVSGAQSTSK